MTEQNTRQVVVSLRDSRRGGDFTQPLDNEYQLEKGFLILEKHEIQSWSKKIRLKSTPWAPIVVPAPNPFIKRVYDYIVSVYRNGDEVCIIADFDTFHYEDELVGLVIALTTGDAAGRWSAPNTTPIKIPIKLMVFQSIYSNIRLPPFRVLHGQLKHLPIHHIVVAYGVLSQEYRIHRSIQELDGTTRFRMILGIVISSRFYPSEQASRALGLCLDHEIREITKYKTAYPAEFNYVFSDLHPEWTKIISSPQLYELEDRDRALTSVRYELSKYKVSRVGSLPSTEWLEWTSICD